MFLSIFRRRMKVLSGLIVISSLANALIRSGVDADVVSYLYPCSLPPNALGYTAAPPGCQCQGPPIDAIVEPTNTCVPGRDGRTYYYYTCKPPSGYYTGPPSYTTTKSKVHYAAHIYVCYDSSCEDCYPSCLDCNGQCLDSEQGSPYGRGSFDIPLDQCEVASEHGCNGGGWRTTKFCRSTFENGRCPNPDYYSPYSGGGGGTSGGY